MHSYMFSSSVWWCFARQFHVLCMRCQRRLKKSQHQLPPRRCFCFLFFAAGPVLPLATSRDQMVEIGWKRLLVIRIDFVQLACTWRDTNYMYYMFKSVALGRSTKVLSTELQYLLLTWRHYRQFLHFWQYISLSNVLSTIPPRHTAEVVKPIHNRHATVTVCDWSWSDRCAHHCSPHKAMTCEMFQQNDTGFCDFLIYIETVCFIVVVFDWKTAHVILFG